ncbi:MAG: hypothetical protein JXK93_03660 [Sphaerochaetaceae bacterium]|nr:hypothetical protein [Sphaerochaetaceae bacterium]
MRVISEKDAAASYARAWNTGKAWSFLRMLDRKVCYASQWVFEEMKGRRAIRKYLKAKLKTMKKGDSPVFAELGVSRIGDPGRDLVIMAQGDKESVQAVVLFEVKQNRIIRFDMCMPGLYQPEGSGEYPGM